MYTRLSWMLCVGVVAIIFQNLRALNIQCSLIGMSAEVCIYKTLCVATNGTVARLFAKFFISIIQSVINVLLFFLYSFTSILQDSLLIFYQYYSVCYQCVVVFLYSFTSILHDSLLSFFISIIQSVINVLLFFYTVIPPFYTTLC